MTTLDAADGPGGKMREVEAGGRLIDAGPTVLTMPWVFEQIFGTRARVYLGNSP